MTLRSWRCATLVGLFVLAIGCSPPSAPIEAVPAKAPATLTIPKDATAQCNDGEWSFAEHKQGACSGHGGVQVWFGTPPPDATARCRDGEYSTSTVAAGTCSKHGGVDWWIEDAPAEN